MTTDTTTPILLATAERAIRNMAVPRYRTEARADLLTVRNQLRSRTAELVERLEKGDAWFAEIGPEPPQGKERQYIQSEELWLELEKDYRKCYDGLRLCEANL